MDFESILTYTQIGIAILLGTVILLQRKGGGLGSAFGGGDGGFYRTKRGAEKVLLVSSVALAVLFITAGIITVATHSSDVQDLPQNLPQAPTDISNQIQIDDSSVQIETEPLLPLTDETTLNDPSTSPLGE